MDLLEINEIEVLNFRNLRDVRIPWDRSVIAFGQNAVGKSNLLDAVLFFFEDKLPKEQVGNSRYRVAIYSRGFDLFERVSRWEGTYLPTRQAWKVALLLKLLGFTEPWPFYMGFRYRSMANGGVWTSSPFIVRKAEKELLSRGAMEIETLAGKPRDSIFDLLVTEEGAYASELLSRKREEEGSDESERARGTRSRGVPDTERHCSPEKVALVSPEALVDVAQSVERVIDEITVTNPDFARIAKKLLGSIGVRIERDSSNGVSNNGSRYDYAYCLDRKTCKSLGGYSRVIEGHEDFRAANEHIESFLSVVFECVKHCTSENGDVAPYVLPLEYERMTITEYDPQVLVPHRIEAVSAKSWTQNVENSIDGRLRAICKAIKAELNEASRGVLEINAILDSSNIRTYLKQVPCSPDKSYGFYLRVLQGSTNYWLKRIFGDALSVKISMKGNRKKPKVSIEIKDFGNPNYFHENQVSSGARRWVDVALQFALDEFNARSNIYRLGGFQWMFPEAAGNASEISDAKELECLSHFLSGRLDEYEGSMKLNIKATDEYNLFRSAITKPLAIIDEPELHLHPGLQKRIAECFDEVGNELQILMATHSVDFLNMDPDKTYFYSVKKGRNNGGLAIVNPISKDRRATIRGLAKEIGATNGQLFQTYSAYLFVEGMHDKAFLQTLYWPRIQRAGVCILPIMGTANTDYLESTLRFFAEVMDTPTFVMFDYIENRDLVEASSDPRQFCRLLGKPREFIGRFPVAGRNHSEQKLIELYSEMARYARENSVSLSTLVPSNVSHSRKDICFFVPPRLVRDYISKQDNHRAGNCTSFDSWENAYKTPCNGDRKRKIGEKYGFIIDEKFLRWSAEELRSLKKRPEVLVELDELVERLLTGCSGSTS